jgi:hypothetical protein
MALVLLAAFAAGCTEDRAASSGTAAAAGDEEDSPPHQTSITVTRADGSTFTFADAEIRCPLGFERDAGEQSVMVAGPGFSELDRPRTFIYIDVVAADIDDGATVTLPLEHHKRPRVVLFVNDYETDNELSSHERDASGTIRIEEATGSPKPSATIHIDATLGSEVDMSPVRVEGSLVLTGP